MCRHPARLLLHIGEYTWLTASLIQDHAEPAELFLLDPILRRFRIIRCNRQAASHSAMFKYTPLVIGGGGGRTKKTTKPKIKKQKNAKKPKK
jgi:hypothetical protein